MYDDSTIALSKNDDSVAKEFFREMFIDRCRLMSWKIPSCMNTPRPEWTKDFGHHVIMALKFGIVLRACDNDINTAANFLIDILRLDNSTSNFIPLSFQEQYHILGPMNDVSKLLITVVKKVTARRASNAVIAESAWVLKDENRELNQQEIKNVKGRFNDRAMNYIVYKTAGVNDRRFEGNDALLAHIEGDNILHHAVRHRNHPLCKFLIDMGADVHILNKYGESAIDIDKEVNIPSGVSCAVQPWMAKKVLNRFENILKSDLTSNFNVFNEKYCIFFLNFCIFKKILFFVHFEIE